MNGTQFTVQMDNFSGPLELLLELVEKRKFFVNEVSLAKVADDYVHQIENYSKLPLAQTAQFLVVASTLLLIKSRSLLPNLELTPEEESDIKELQKRLALYRKIREGAAILRSISLDRQLLHPKKSQPLPQLLVNPTDLSIRVLFDRIKNLINEFPTFMKKPEIGVESVISLPEMVDKLTKRIKREVRTRFSSIKESEDLGSFIVSFLALLELVRQGVVNVRQESKYADIDIETEQVAVPNY